MSPSCDDVSRLPATVLFCLGIVDLVRGVMHTFLLRWSGVNIAGFDPVTTSSDQFLMLGAFGISNFLTGLVFVLISRKARDLSVYVLAAIPVAYLLGMIGIGLSRVQMESAFRGQYMMMVYLGVCIVTVVVVVVRRWSPTCRPGR